MTTAELAFEDAAAFLQVWDGGMSKGTCFVPWPRELPTDEPIALKIEIYGIAAAVLEGRLASNGTDTWGQPGFVVALSDNGKAAAAIFHRQVAASLPQLNVTPAPMPPEAFATTSLFHKGSGKLEQRAKDADAPQDPLLEPGTLLDNRFQIESHIATGGMGEVYRALHVYLKRPIALKLLRRSLLNDPDMWARFQREAELVSQLESPHVVRVFDFGKTSTEQPFLAMEFVEGATLDLVLKQEGRLSPARAVAVLIQLCDGLAEAHAMGIIHRDLKPPNVMFGKRRDGTPIAKILDFGIARIADTKKGNSLTQIGMVIGTPAYIAPEQALADTLDARTDIYALGCVAFELLTGRTPFDGDSLQALITKHLTEQPVSPAAVNPELAALPLLCATVLRALAKDRAQRFQDVKSFAEALQAGLQRFDAPPTPVPQSAFADWASANLTPPPGAAPPAAAPMELWPPPPPPTFSSTVQPEAPRPQVSVKAPPPGTPLPGSLAAAVALPADPSVQRKRLAKAFETFKLPLPAETVQQVVEARAALEGLAERTTLLYVEVLSAAPNSPLKVRCLCRAICAALDFGGTVEALDEDALVLVFTGEGQTVTGRALLALIELREIVADERRLTGPGEPVSIRAAASNGRVEFPAADRQYEGDLLRKARGLAAKTPAGKVIADRTLAVFCEDVLELKDSPPGLNECVELGDARPLLPTNSPRMIGREAAFAQLDKRLTQISAGVNQPIVVTAAAGGGKSTLAQELAARARQLSIVVAMAHGLRSFHHQPFGALSEILCNVCGVPTDQRTARLRPALEALKLGAPELAAALVVGGVEQPPQPFTPGQAIYALRAVLNMGAGGRKVLVVLDGLESMDSFSVEAFRVLCAQPAPREQTVGFAERAFATENLPNLPVIDLPQLTGREIPDFVKALLGGAEADEKLHSFMIGHSAKLPSRLVDWMHLLADRGWLRLRGSTFMMPDEPKGIDPEQLAAARTRALGPAAARIFDAICLGGDAPNSALLSAVLPETPPAAYQRLVNSRLVRALSGKRWMSVSARLSDTVMARENAILHRRLAQALLEEARAAGVQPDAALLADHLSRGGDTARALPLWRHAAEAAVSRRAPRDLLVALKGWADALGAVLGAGPPSADAIRARADSLARASGIALVIGDATAARSLAEEAEQVATVGMIESAEPPLAMARVLRSEARRAKASEALAVAEKRAANSPVMALCQVERGEAREAEGDVVGAITAFRQGLALADGARDFARWHGEVDLRARVEARLGGLLLSQKDFGGARTLLVSALDGWRKAGYAWGESRVLANLGTVRAQANEFTEAARWFAEAVSAAGRCGDLLFQARSLLNLARVEKRAKPGSERANAERARRVAMSIGWEDGRKQADALFTG